MYGVGCGLLLVGWLLVIGRWLQVVDFRLLVAGCAFCLLCVCCWFFVPFLGLCLLCVACCVWLVSCWCCLLRVCNCLCLVVGCLMVLLCWLCGERGSLLIVFFFVLARCVLIVMCWLLFVVCLLFARCLLVVCLSFGVRCLVSVVRRVWFFVCCDLRVL